MCGDDKCIPLRCDWERQECESTLAYKAFRIWLEANDRNFDNVASEVNKSRKTIIRWAEKFDWERRAAVFDYFRAEADKEHAERETNKMAGLQINLGRMLQAEGAKALKDKDLSEEPVAVILKAIELGIQIERSARNIEKKTI